MAGKRKGKKKSSGAVKTVVGVIALVVLLIGGFFGYQYYQKIFAPNVPKEKERYIAFIPSGATFDDVIQSLTDSNVIKNKESFIWVAERMNYSEGIKAGRYILKPGMNNRQLVMLLRSGRQTPVNLVINKFRTKENLVKHVASQLEADSLSLMILLNDKAYLRQFGFKTDNALAAIIPNTYEFFWNTSAEEFFERMTKEYERFWNDERKSKASKLNLSPEEVIVLASIVEEEYKKPDERTKIAGVYLNRLQRGMYLQADPTVRFAMGDFGIRRVLKVHLEYDSPYNTYRNSGLPPGPICTPSITTIDAVLNAEDHKYLYFCAKHDFSGYHAFARTYDEHLNNARRFQRELNRRGILN